VLVKAAAGGGGRGMRLVTAADELDDAYSRASAEALAAFGDGTLYVEKAITPARHVEIQVMCDSYGGVLTCGERECSIQRRHQKLIEESPSPAAGAKACARSRIRAIWRARCARPARKRARHLATRRCISNAG